MELYDIGTPATRVARVYPDDGHIAAKNEREWGPAAWKWLREQLTRYPRTSRPQPSPVCGNWMRSATGHSEANWLTNETARG